MTTVSVSNARAHLPELLNAVADEPVVTERRVRRAGVILSPERYEQMLDAVEERHDIAAFHTAMDEEGVSIPWAQVKADLGWV